MEKQILFEIDDLVVYQKGEKFYMDNEESETVELIPVASVHYNLLSDVLDEDDLLVGNVKVPVDEERLITTNVKEFDVCGEQVTDEEIIYWYFREA